MIEGWVMSSKLFTTIFSVLASILGGIYFIWLGLTIMKFGPMETFATIWWRAEFGFLILLLGFVFLIAFRLAYVMERWPRFYRSRFWGLPGILLAVNYGVIVPFLLLMALLPQIDAWGWTDSLGTAAYLKKIIPSGEASNFGYALVVMIILTLVSGGISLLSYSLKRIVGNPGRLKEVRLQSA